MFHVLRLTRFVARLLALALAVLLIAGFIAQFAPARRYPWVPVVRSYTSPVSRLVAEYVPTTYGGVDGSLLLTLVALWALYAVADRGLDGVEGVLRSSLVRSRVSAATARAASQTPPASAPAAPTAGAPAYMSEALLVIDLVKSTDLVSRFGNSFFFSLKQRMEQLVTPIASRHSATYSESTGDGFLICFPSVAHATGAVQEIFQTLPSMNVGLPEGAEAALRAAVNFGEVIIAKSGGNRTGSAVHKTFRLQGVGAANLIETEGGIRRDEFPQKNSVVISEEALSGVAKLSGFQSRFLGLTELKGFPGLHRVYQLEWQA